MNKLTLFLIAMFICFNANAKNLGFGLELSPLVDKVDNQVKKTSLSEKYFFWRKLDVPCCSGIAILIAFEKRGLKSPVTPDAVKKYTISNLLHTLDTSICQALVRERSKRGMQSFNDYTKEDFQRFDDIKRNYFDALPAILQENYGEAAAPYITEIKQARTAFEAKNDGRLLLEL